MGRGLASTVRMICSGLESLCSNVEQTWTRLTICMRVALSVCVAVNDGFFGHSNVTGNLIFAMVRETNDHGPLNSWVSVCDIHRTTMSLSLRFGIHLCSFSIGRGDRIVNPI